MFFTSY